MVDKIEIVGIYKIVQVRTVRDGEYFRYGLTPGSDIANEPQEVQDFCNQNWTQDVIDAYNNRPTEDEL